MDEFGWNSSEIWILSSRRKMWSRHRLKWSKLNGDAFMIQKKLKRFTTLRVIWPPTAFIALLKEFTRFHHDTVTELNSRQGTQKCAVWHKQLRDSCFIRNAADFWAEHPLRRNINEQKPWTEHVYSCYRGGVASFYQITSSIAFLRKSLQKLPDVRRY